jgi:hypothetical protein
MIGESQRPARDRSAEGEENFITVPGDSWDTPEKIRTLSLRAESVTLPGMSFASADGLPPRFGYGTVEGIPYNAIFDPVTINFAIDGKGTVYRFFYSWAKSIVNFEARGQNPRNLSTTNDTPGMQTYEVQYKDNYVRDIIIQVYKPYQNPVKEDYLMELKLYRAYPRNFSPLQMSWEERNNYLRLPITFDYTDFDVKFKNKKH